MEAWDGFVNHRQGMKKPLTGRAVATLIENLSKWRGKGVDVADALNASVIGGYQGVFEPRMNGKRAPPESKLSWMSNAFAATATPEFDLDLKPERFNGHE